MGRRSKNHKQWSTVTVNKKSDNEQIIYWVVDSECRKQQVYEGMLVKDRCKENRPD